MTDPTDTETSASAKANLLTVLGIQASEDAITNALAFGVNGSERFARFLVSKLAPQLAANYSRWRAHTRVATRVGVPDLILTGWSDRGYALLVIEHKLGAEEGDDQTERYTSKGCLDDLKAKLLNGSDVQQTAFVFLTLFPDLKAKSAAFHSYSHRILCDFEPADNGDADRLIGDWIELLREFYDCDRLQDSEPVIRMLNKGPLEGGYLYFMRLMSALPLTQGLSLEACSKHSRSGRRFYLTQFAKDAWRAGKWVEDSGQWSLSDPNRHYNIHIEPQFSVLSGTLNVYLHYETNDYATQDWTKKNLASAHLDAYLSRRSAFVNAVAALKLPSLKIGGGWNQVARWSLDFGDKTTSEAVAALSSGLSEIASAVDRALEQIDLGP